MAQKIGKETDLNKGPHVPVQTITGPKGGASALTASETPYWPQRAIRLPRFLSPNTGVIVPYQVESATFEAAGNSGSVCKLHIEFSRLFE